MLIAVILAVSAEAGVAGVVLVLVGRLLVVDLSWLRLNVDVRRWLGLDMVVVVVNRDGNLNRNWDRDVLLHRDVLLDGHRVGAVNGDLHGVGDGLLDGVGDMLLDVVGLRNGHLHWVRDRSLNGHRHRTVNRNLDWVWDGLFDGVRDGLLNRDRVRLGHWDGVGTVNGHLHLNGDLLLNDVRHGLLDFHLVRDGDVLHDFVGLRNGDLHWVRDVLGHFIGLRYQHFDGVRTVYGDMDWVGDFLLHWVWSWHVDWDFDVFLDMDRHMLDHFVGLRDGNLNRVWHVLFNGVGNVLLDGVWHWDTLGDGNGFGDIGVRTNQEGLAVLAAVMATVVTTVGRSRLIGRSRAVGTSHVAMSADVTDVESVDSVPVAQVQQTTFVQLLLQRHGIRFLLLLLL